MSHAGTVPVDRQTGVDFDAIKSRQRGAWTAGNYRVIGTTLQLVGETLCEAIDLRAGQRVLDVATGNGNAALAAARRGGEVAGIDYVPALLANARERAAADGLAIEFREGDAEALPYTDGHFDAVLSTFGVMFTTRHAVAAGELLRVCRSGGKIGLANWTPDGFIGQLLKAVGRHVAPPPGAVSPTAWGTRAGIMDLFEAQAASIVSVERHFVFRYRDADDWLSTFRTFYGPVLKAFESLNKVGQASLECDLLALAAQFNRPGERSLVVPSSYLETVITCA